ncbi:FAD-binding oxidoreductase [Bosea caraganae]|uniref:FAD-binding oxidoreductase n=1 Tax=Bosea caraganae TaxID=2763117 RepID=A0A370LCT3_9HYPH|nr:FAD-dependent oxidoreductase [Bosea caraganae]RDJ27753.1 FAD-binding oxidoreductase [Bosea caraganae]RDJ29766.1 FAD-binding oxidoreductase [Bosea caraganae]
MKHEADITVIGGGLVGTAIAFGLAQDGARVMMLDEGDIARRASRANFALVWVQAKGIGMPEYATWSKVSADGWAEFAEMLADVSDIDVAFERPGGFMMCLSEAEMEARVRGMKVLQAQPGAPLYPYEILDHAQTKKRMPAIGPDVVGSVYCDLDGHVNSLRLFRALHVAIARLGVSYRPEHAVEAIVPEKDGFRIRGPWGEVATGRVVIAAGLDNARLAPMVGLLAPVVPSKGQIIVTEKAARFLDYPVSTVRQTDEGGVMVGDSQEDLGFDTQVTYPVISLMAQRAVRMFPALAGLNVVRTWSASRVMSPDGFPIYEQSRQFPGAFVATCHSGVTLAAAHALRLAIYIQDGRLPEQMACFSARRLNVPQAA